MTVHSTIAAQPRSRRAWVVAGIGGFYGNPGDVLWIPAEAGAVTESVQTRGAYAVGSGPDGVWVARPGGAARLAAASSFVGRLDDEVRLPCCASSATGVAVGAGGVWVLGDIVRPELWRIVPGRTGALATVALPFAPSAVAAGAGGVWVAGQLADEWRASTRRRTGSPRSSRWAGSRSEWRSATAPSGSRIPSTGR